ncbi:LysR family transcriptional regulator [Aliiglaciecola sp.]|nr:LysR family transcriptional regulator [Aliiglaciecola sp.]
MDKIEMMRVFTVVARKTSFTRAADELGLATQTVSKYVKALEDQLDVQLFDRTTRRVNLNHTGKAYFERCIELLDQFDELDSSVKTQHGSPQGKIRISAPTSFGELHLVPGLRDFQLQHPKISIDLDLSNSRVSMVEDGFDLVLRIGQLPDSSMIAKKLSPMRVSICATPDYLKKHGKPEHPSDLVNHNCFVDTNFRYTKHWPFIINGQETRVDVTGNFQSNSPGSNFKMVLAGLGIGMCPMYVISSHLVTGQLVTLFDDFEASQFGVYAIYPHRKHLSRRVRVLVDFLAARFRQMS